MPLDVAFSPPTIDRLAARIVNWPKANNLGVSAPLREAGFFLSHAEAQRRREPTFVGRDGTMTASVKCNSPTRFTRSSNNLSQKEIISWMEGQDNRKSCNIGTLGELHVTISPLGQQHWDWRLQWCCVNRPGSFWRLSHLLLQITLLVLRSIKSYIFKCS